MKFNFMIMILVSLLVVACGGGGGGGGGVAGGGTTLSGTLVDAEIQGVAYDSPSYSGVTNASGIYQCKTGETVDFSLPGTNGESVYLGSIGCRQLTSPIEVITQGAFTVAHAITDLSAPHQIAVKNVLRLLQSLDSDGDASNGISINSDDVSVLAQYLATNDPGYDSEDVDVDYFLDKTIGDMTTELMGVMSAVGRAANVVSEADAVAHFETTQTRCDLNGCSGPDAGGEEPTASIAFCLSGQTFATTVPEGQGFVGTDNLPVNNVTGAVEVHGESSYPGELYDTLFVMYTDGTAKAFRKKGAPSQPYFYEFTTMGWTNNLEVDLNNNGSADEGDSTQLVIAGVGFAQMSRPLRFEYLTVGETVLQDPNMPVGQLTDFGDRAGYTREFTKTTSCEVPTGTVMVEAGGFPTF